MSQEKESRPLVIAGHPYAPIGMGEHSRSTFRALSAVGVQTQILDVYRHIDKPDPDFVSEFGSSVTGKLSPEVNIITLNGDEIEPALRHLNDSNFDQAYNVVFPAWELETYPPEWARLIERFDEVWTPSRFVADAIAKSVDRPVIPIGLPVAPKLSSFIGRRGLGLPEHTFLFLFMFDFSSYASRKNPYAVIDAFNAAVEAAPKARMHLVLKAKGLPAEKTELDRFREAVSPHADQITVIDRLMTTNETYNLIRNVDCLVSLHRSEGFGLSLAEAMAMGTPVIATGWSGNTDFMTPENSILLKYRLVPLKQGEYPFADGQRWADAMTDNATDAMLEVWGNRQAAWQRAAVARRDISRLLSPRAVGLAMLDRLENGPASKAYSSLLRAPA